MKDEPAGYIAVYKENNNMSINIDTKISNLDYKYIGENVYHYMFSHSLTKYVNHEDLYPSEYNGGIGLFKLNMSNYILPYGKELIKKEKGNLMEWF